MNMNEARQLIISCLDQVKLLTPADLDHLSTNQDADIELSSLPIDSLKVVDLCMALEDALNRDIDVEVLIENSSVNKLATFFTR